jgi:hypothetical protein
VEETSCFLEQNQGVFVFEDELWAIKGRYQSALSSNDDIDWSVLENQFVLHLLIVSVKDITFTNIAHISVYKDR